MLGYCLFPLNVASLIIFCTKSVLPGILKVLIVVLAFAWSIVASVGFISSMVPADRKALAVFPVCLFFFFLSWFAIL